MDHQTLKNEVWSTYNGDKFFPDLRKAMDSALASSQDILRSGFEDTTLCDCSGHIRRDKIREACRETSLYYGFKVRDYRPTSPWHTLEITNGNLTIIPVRVRNQGAPVGRSKYRNVMLASNQDMLPLPEFEDFRKPDGHVSLFLAYSLADASMVRHHRTGIAVASLEVVFATLDNLRGDRIDVGQAWTTEPEIITIPQIEIIPRRKPGNDGVAHGA